jgi:predicted RecB family nuclease
MRAKCSHCVRLATARELDVSGVRELTDQFKVQPDNLAIRYGMRFEDDLESELLANLGDKVQMPVGRSLDATLELMNEGVPVIYQGVLQGGSGSMAFSGRPDFLLRSDYRFEFTSSGLSARQVDGWSGGYTAWDAKLSSSPKPEYQNQVGLYADVLKELGYLAENNHGLILGSRELATFEADALISQMIGERNAYLKKVFAFIDEDPQRVEDIGTLICDASSYCDICEYPDLCQHQRVETNHLQLVAGITRPQIESLNRSGTKTVRQLAERDEPTDKLSKETVGKLAMQARLQQHTYDTGEHIVEVVHPEELQKLPPENEGDIFFDLEGFTFFAEPGGLEYLFGYTSIDGGERFHADWADTREEEKEIFEKFMHDLMNRLQSYPDAKVYHYANYEQAALKKLAERHGSYEAEVAEVLNDGVFIDLYKLVKASIMISQESYSIKKLENYFSFGRASEVKEAMGSMEYYDQYLKALEEDKAAAENLKRQVIAYNQDDCASTLALTRWLRSLVNRDV